MQIVADLYDAPVDYQVIATTGKGERLDRPELTKVEDLLRSRKLDLLIAEDIGRIVRGTEASWLCGIAVDHGTRVIAPNDCIDTAEPSWEEDVISACRDHVGHNAHTSKRIKHKLMNRFKKFGGATARPIYGYVVPEEAKTYDQWKKDPSATDIFQEWFRELKEHRNCSRIAVWLNAREVPLGPYTRCGKWSGQMVRRLTRNPLLKGMPGRGYKHTVKHHETGRRMPVKNPTGPTFRECPHLVHIEPDLFDEVNHVLDQANKGCGRKPVNGADPLFGRPKKRTRFPGQHTRCWYCGRIYVWGGNGLTENLMCSGSREWKCWNSIGICGERAATAVASALRSELDQLEGFDAQFRSLVEEAGRQSGGSERQADLERRTVSLRTQKTNLGNAIAEYGPKPMFKEVLAKIEMEEKQLARERKDLERLQAGTLLLPGSVAELREEFEGRFRDLSLKSPEFGSLLKNLVPEFHVYLVRLCDGGHLLPRARVTLALASLIPGFRQVPTVSSLLTRTITLDLFEPPQRERIRADVVRLTAEGIHQREIASRLPGSVTQAAVSKAMCLDRQMRNLGLESPYVLLAEPPADYLKLRRHQNSNYRFESLPGYERSDL
ncbi:MAG: recombinase family protein [Planctomycetes bacterium]|nr:recombinase family protein [Planctomycetota bacterium]